MEALATLDGCYFDLVVTDIRMPELNGIELLQAIKSRYPEMPVVIITGYPLAYPPEKASTEGAAGYIAKPFRINQIDKLLGKILYNFENKEF
jgi:two-component system response regulator FlrC